MKNCENVSEPGVGGGFPVALVIAPGHQRVTAADVYHPADPRVEGLRPQRVAGPDHLQAALPAPVRYHPLACEGCVLVC